MRALFINKTDGEIGEPGTRGTGKPENERPFPIIRFPIYPIIPPDFPVSRFPDYPFPYTIDI